MSNFFEISSEGKEKLDNSSGWEGGLRGLPEDEVEETQCHNKQRYPNISAKRPQKRAYFREFSLSFLFYFKIIFN